jgi:hypothetical protein
LEGDELSIRGQPYPNYAKVIYWIISFLPLVPIPLLAIYNIIKFKFNWRTLLCNDPTYYNKANKFNNNSSTYTDDDVKLIDTTQPPPDYNSIFDI